MEQEQILQDQLRHLLNEAKENGMKLRGDWLNGYFFVGENEEYYQKKAKEICSGMVDTDSWKIIIDSEIEFVKEELK